MAKIGSSGPARPRPAARRSSPCTFQWARSVFDRQRREADRATPVLAFLGFWFSSPVSLVVSNERSTLSCRRQRRSPSRPSRTPRRVEFRSRARPRRGCRAADRARADGRARRRSPIRSGSRSRSSSTRGGRATAAGFCLISPMSARGRAPGAASDGQWPTVTGSERLSADPALAHERRIKLGQMAWLDALQLRAAKARHDLIDPSWLHRSRVFGETLIAAQSRSHRIKNSPSVSLQ